VEITIVFVSGGQHYDCVGIDQQPAVRNFHFPASRLPAAGDGRQAGHRAGQRAAANWTRKRPWMSSATRRTARPIRAPAAHHSGDAEPLAHLGRLLPQDARRRGGRGAGRGTRMAQKRIPPIPRPRRTSIRSPNQNVNNWGGNSNNNIWDPYVNTSLGEVFSLSQEWYVGGSGSGTQTRKWAGWSIRHVQRRAVHFFIFSHAGQLQQKRHQVNCWNNTCGDFVQVADSGILGNYSKREFDGRDAV